MAEPRTQHKVKAFEKNKSVRVISLRNEDEKSLALKNIEISKKRKREKKEKRQTAMRKPIINEEKKAKQNIHAHMNQQMNTLDKRFFVVNIAVAEEENAAHVQKKNDNDINTN